MPEQPSCAWDGPTPAPTPNSDPVSFEFSIPRSTGNPDVMPKYPQSPQYTQTSPPNQTLPEITAIPHLVAGGNSSQPDPIKDSLSPDQLLQQQEARWLRCFEEQEKKLQELQELQATFFESSRLSDANYQESFERIEKENQRFLEQEVKTETRIVGSSPLLVSLLFLTGILCALLYERIDDMKLQGGFNLAGALSKQSRPLFILVVANVRLQSSWYMRQN